VQQANIDACSSFSILELVSTFHSSPHLVELIVLSSITNKSLASERDEREAPA
jgi:hypothetical protein